MTTGEQIVAEARSWCGTPFFHTGREKGIGCDCAGLILGVWHALGLTTWDDRQYAPGGDAERLQAGLRQFCECVGRKGLRGVHEDTEPPLIQPGDVLLLAMRGQPIHAGIATGEGTFVHTLDEGVKQVIEVPLDEHWRKRVVSVWRWRGGD